MITDQNDPQHFAWHGLFCLHSWWINSDNQVFVIVLRMHAETGADNPDGRAMEYVELLYKNKEFPVRMEWLDLVNKFKAGQLRRTSTQD